jgi:pimeloyl-ACP methyl ester carboxylesterase
LPKTLNRQLFYIAGFDPRGPSVYHAMMKTGYANHCAQRDMQGEMSARQRETHRENTWHVWQAQTNYGDCQITTRFTFLDWSDLVRTLWVRPDALALFKGAYASILAARLNIPQQMYRLSWPILITGSVPLIVIVGWTLISFALLACFWAIVTGWYFTGIVGLAAVSGVGAWLRNFFIRFNAPWAARIYRFIYKGSTEPMMANWTKIDAMADAILEAISKPTNDEVVVVAHSIGTITAVMVMGRALEKNGNLINDAVQNNRLVFVTLGQTIPLIVPSSSIVTRALETLGKSNVPWLDISAPADPACFALTDPCREVLGMAPRVHLKSAQFHKNFSPETYTHAKRDRFHMHFLYLLAPDGVGTALPSFDFYEFVTNDTVLATKLPSSVLPVEPFFKKPNKEFRA